MENYLSRLSLNRKLLLLLLTVVLLITTLTTSVILVSSLHFIRAQYLPASLEAIAKVLTQPELIQPLLKHPEVAHEKLQQITPASIALAALYDDQGQKLAGFQRNSDAALPQTLDELQSVYPKALLTAIPPLSPDHPLATLVIAAAPDLTSGLYRNLEIAGLFILLGFILVMLVVTGLIQHFITQPILHLIRLANTVSIEENYSARAKKFYGDEIGVLATAFNTMLSRIEARDQLLLGARDRAERAGRQAQELASETRQSNQKLAQEVEVRRQAEAELTEFQNYLRNIIDSMPSALITVNEALEVTQWNHAASALSGMGHDFGIGLKLDQVLASLIPYLDPILFALQQNQIQRVERVSLDNDDRVFDLMVYPLRGRKSRGAVLRIDDITERLHLQEMMVQSEKMHSVGGLAAGMAHEINNPLGGILQGVQNIRRRLSPDLPKNLLTAEELGVDLARVLEYLDQRGILKFLDHISDAGERASHIVANMLQFSRRSSRTPSRCDLAELIRQTLEIAHHDLTVKQGFDLEGIALKLELDPELPPVPCIANEIEQVLLNLVKNSVQAIMAREQPQQGLVLIRLRRVGDSAEISIEDNGIGMSRALCKRIFEPFFTTKEVGHGTGLGLSVSYFIISHTHRGSLTVSSTEGVGTTFTIHLPLQVSTPQPA